MSNYDIAVIGGGPAGYKAAALAGKLGKNVVLIEKKLTHLGGTCLNEGCIPVKSLSETAHLADLARKSVEFGVVLGEVKIELALARQNYERKAETLRKGVSQLLKQTKVTVIEGSASFSDAHTLEVTHTSGTVETLEAAQILIASGSRPKLIPGLALPGKRVLTSTSCLELTEVPARLLVIGGGAIGCEFASIYRSLGSKVTLAEFLPKLLGKEDAEASRTLERELSKKGVEILCGAQVKKVQETAAGVETEILTAEGESLNGLYDAVLLAVGREANLDGLGLEKAGVKIEAGCIVTDEFLRTSASHIYAAGDVVKTPMFAHTAYFEGKIAVKNMLGKAASIATYPAVPRIVFTDPQVGAVGLTEEEAKNSGMEYKVSKQFFKANGRAVVMGSDGGFVKLIAGADGKVVGGAIVGPLATEIVHSIAVAVSNGLTMEQLASTLFAHPTLSEAVQDAAENAHL